MANLMRPQAAGPAELGYRGMVKMADLLERLDPAPAPG